MKNTHQIATIERAMKHAGETALLSKYVNDTLKVLSFYNKNDRPCLAWWWNNSKAMSGPYYYLSKDARDKKLGDLIEVAEYKEKEKAERARRKRENRVSADVGQLFYTSWGYDQTNVDFYQVLEKIGKATVLLQEIGSEYTDNDYGRVKPRPDKKFGEPFRARICEYGIKVGRQYAKATTEDNTHYCTPPGMGH
ncbi:MAG: hypothetical protein KDC67_10450 [Ignavibacteriae bacterium]|nr:hypothetical protein [Ignavibacteriota bacterium]